MSFWMLSEASDIVICYALLLCIKANVEEEKSYIVCVITPASNNHLSVLFYPFNSLETQTGIHFVYQCRYFALRSLCVLWL